MLSRLIRPRSSSISLGVRMASSTSVGKLAGKVAVVTASTDGIGFAIARRLGQDGAKVMVSSRKQQNVDAAVGKMKAENLNVSGVTCHVGKKEDRTKLIEQTLKDFGGIDILVSNAGINPVFGPMLDTSAETWDKIFDVNVKAAFLLCQEAVPHMQARGGGSIILVSSIVAYSPMLFLGAYSVSKTALVGLGKALAPELAQSNIRINVLAPGMVNTKFSSTILQNEEAVKQILASVPLGRLSEAEDMAGPVSFLASDDSKYMTGETLLVTGGMTARL